MKAGDVVYLRVTLDKVYDDTVTINEIEAGCVAFDRKDIIAINTTGFKIIYLDHDVNYKSYFSSQKWEAIKRWVPEIRKVYGNFELYIRESSNGKTHFKLEFPIEIPLHDSMVIRALLADDAYRLIMDLKRCSNQPEETNRIFDEKWSDGQLKKAGEWHKIPVNL